MEISSRDSIVYDVIRELRNALLDYARPLLTVEFGDDLDAEVRRLYRKIWDDIERSAAEARDTRMTSREPLDALDHLSIGHLSVVIEKWWSLLVPDPTLDEAIIKRQRTRILQWLNELAAIRNPVAHPPTKSLPDEDAIRAVDTAMRLASIFSLDSEEHFLAVYEELRSPGSGDNELVVSELPSRELITTDFIGRESHLEELHMWLVDPDRRTWLLAGDGGKGKTTIAYEFALRSRQDLGECGLRGALWMSAKRRRFVEGGVIPTTAADFVDLDSALCHILDRLGLKPDPDMERREQRNICRQLLEEFPLLIIADDIDSLEGEEEEAIEFLVHDVARTPSKVLMTSRRQHFGLGGSTTQIEGLNEEEVATLVRRRVKDLGIDSSSVNIRTIREIRSITDGSPLYIEDLLRFAAFYSLSGAIHEWSGRKGDSAREYSMKRELEQLSENARICLAALAYADDSLSLVECAVIAELPDEDTVDALDELSRWNLAMKPGLIEGVPRFGCSRNLAKLMRRTLQGTDQEVRIRNGLSGIKGRTVSSSRVRSYNQQAVVFKQRGEQEEAERTLLAGLEEVPNSGGLYSQLGWLYSKWEPNARITDASEAFEKARRLGAQSSDLYYHWANMKLQTREYRQAAELCDEAVETVGRENCIIHILGARAHKKLGLQHEQGLATERAERSYEAARQLLQKASVLARSERDSSRLFDERYDLARVRRDQDEMRRALEEWEQELPDDAFRTGKTR